MGIVVCVTMLFGLLGLLKKRGKTPGKGALLEAIYTQAPSLSILIGLWNFAWYGLRHLGSFWGHTALATGLVMLMTGVILLVESNSGGKLNRAPILLTTYKLLKPIRVPVAIALLSGFLLYAVTLVQLNLGYEIIR